MRSDEPMATTEERVRRIVEEGLRIKVPAVDTDLFATGAIDSLGFVELLVRLEEEFGRKIALEALEIGDFKSVGRIAAFLSRDGDGEVG